MLAAGSTYQRLETGLRPDGNADADSAMSSAISPDGKTLVVLTSGFNTGISYQIKAPTPSGAYLNANNGVYPQPNPILIPALDPLTGKRVSLKDSAGLSNGPNQTEWVFVYDVTSGHAYNVQRIALPDAYNGIVWSPAGDRFYVSGGIDDRILVYKKKPIAGASTIAYVPDAPFLILGHNQNDTQPVPTYKGSSLGHAPVAFGPQAPFITGPHGLALAATVAGFDISRDGKTIVAANFHNASASIVQVDTRAVTDVVFTPDGTTDPRLAIGEFPFWVSVKSDPTTGAYAKAYVTSERDNQVVVMNGAAVSAVIPVPSGPTKSLLDPTQRLLYVACSNDDSIAVIDTTADRYLGKISVGIPGYAYKGASPNSLALSPDGKLYVTLGGWNAVAVVDLRSNSVLGRIPTGWLPTSVSVTPNGKRLFIVNEKSPAGPNMGNLYYAWNTVAGASTNPTFRNEYTWELEKSGLLAMPTPDPTYLAYLTNAVDANNNFRQANAEPPIMKFLQSQIKHVVYIVNENRTFDQVLGDLGNGSNGDPALTFFTKNLTPNLHALAANYVTLDNFYDSSETSGVGWNWAMQGRTTDYVEKTQPVDYGNGAAGFSYDWQGIVDNINLGLPPTGPASIFTTRITGILDPSGSSTILPGTNDPSATEGYKDNTSPQTLGGYVWETVQRKYGMNSVRNYGWQIDLNAYSYPAPLSPPLIRHPYATKTLEAQPSTPSIQPVTDRYYRAFDQRYPDIFRIEEWAREFKSGIFPALETMTIPHDHTGSLGTGSSSAIEGLGTPQLELADHDYAVGNLVQAISNSPYWKSTVIVMIEDDPQDGQDHVEAHRSIIHIISPWTRSHSVDHTTYFTTSALRTVEDLLGVNHLGFNDANAMPIADAFTTTPTMKPYTSIIPGVLCHAPVASDLVPACKNSAAPRTAPVAQLHDAAWWGKATAGLDFSRPDHINPQYYNAILEYGITGHGTLPQKTATALESKAYDAGDADGDGK